MQSVRGNTGGNLDRQGAEQLNAAVAVRTTQFHIDDTEQERRLCQRGIEFNNKLRSDDVAAENACGAPSPAEHLREPRQGICGRGFNCKGNDRFAVPSAFRDALLQIDRIRTRRPFDEHVRTRKRMLRSKLYTNPVARQCRGDASLQSLAGHCIDA